MEKCEINGNEIKNIENILILQKYISSQILLKNIKSLSFTQTSFKRWFISTLTSWRFNF